MKEWFSLSAMDLVVLPLLTVVIIHIMVNAQRHWRTVRGRITLSDFGEHTSNPLVRYAYEIDGQSYVGDTVCSLYWTSHSPATAQQLIDRYPVGTEVDVYVNPRRPSVAVLEPGGHAHFFGVAYTGALFVFLMKFQDLF